MTADPPRPFGIDRTEFGVALHGTVDLAARPALLAALDGAIEETDGPFVVDLADVDFLDSSGLGVLVHARARLSRTDRRLTVYCPPGPTRRLIELTGVEELLFPQPR
jgi:anti-sigma B factor antagonist